MKILQAKLSNTTAYLLLIFAVASTGLFLYNQFVNLEASTMTNTESSSMINSIEEESNLEESEMIYEDGMTPESDMQIGIPASDTPATESSTLE